MGASPSTISDCTESSDDPTGVPASSALCAFARPHGSEELSGSLGEGSVLPTSSLQDAGLSGCG